MPHDSYSLHQLKVKFSVYRNFVYIIVDKETKEAAIVDPSWDLEKILGSVVKLKVKVTAILLTHAHYDHIYNVQPLVKLLNPRVYMSFKEIQFYNFKCGNLYAFEHLEIIHLGGTPITCLLTPGHTAGSSSYLLSKSLFTGDTVFIEGCGICSIRGGSPEEMFDSIQMLKLKVPSNVQIYPAHSFGKQPGCPFAHLKEENIYFLIKKKEDFIKFRMRRIQGNAFNFR